MNLLQRMQSPTPKFFKTIRNIGLVLVSASAVVLAAPVALPVALVQAAVYAGIAGTVASAISQATTETGDQPPVENNKNYGDEWEY